jgi:hypothetical protein
VRLSAVGGHREDVLIFTVDVPIVLVSEANAREHWSARHRRRKEQRQMVALAWRAAGVKVPVFHVAHVELTRLCPPRNRSKDSDNLAMSLKSVRDEVAVLLGRDDADLRGESIRWECKQLPNLRHLVKIKVTLDPDLSTGGTA